MIELKTEDVSYIENKLTKANQSTIDDIVSVLNCDSMEWGDCDTWYEIFKENMKQACSEMKDLNWRALESYCFKFYREDRCEDGEMHDMEDRLEELRKANA